MLEVNLNFENVNRTILSYNSFILGIILFDDLREKLGSELDNFYLIYNGLLVKEETLLQNGEIRVTPRVFGGKGGFGSMLRAIGAQIEKTTNREACRDLSGRRLRDINQEKKIKEWFEKQKQRYEEREERKRKKIAKLCAQPKHEFKDVKYEKERKELTDRLEDAVEEGFKVAATAAKLKRKKEEDEKINPKKRVKTILDSDESDSSSDDSLSDEEEAAQKLKKEFEDMVAQLQAKPSSSDMSTSYTNDNRQSDNSGSSNSNNSSIIQCSVNSNLLNHLEPAKSNESEDTSR